MAPKPAVVKEKSKKAASKAAAKAEEVKESASATATSVSKQVDGAAQDLKQRSAVKEQKVAEQ